MSHTDSSIIKNMVFVIAALVVFMIIIIIAANWLSKSSINVQDDPMVQDEPILIFQDTGIESQLDRHTRFALADPLGVFFK